MSEKREMYADQEAIRLERDKGGGRYVYTFPDGQEAELNFVERSPGILIVTHTGTPRSWRGRGTAAALVERLANDLRQSGERAVPLCWYARDQFAAHPEWHDLLHEGSH